MLIQIIRPANTLRELGSLIHSDNQACQQSTIKLNQTIKESILLAQEQTLFFRRMFSRYCLPLLLRKLLQLILLCCASDYALKDRELKGCTRRPSPFCSLIIRYSMAIGASSPTVSLQGRILTLIISHRSRRIWFSFINAKVSFSCFQMWSFRPSIFNRRVELAEMRSRIMAIDSMIYFGDLMDFPFDEPPVSRCSYVFQGIL